MVINKDKQEVTRDTKIGWSLKENKLHHTCKGRNLVKLSKNGEEMMKRTEKNESVE